MVLFGGLKEVDEKGRPIKLVAQGYIDNFVPGEALTDRLVGLLRVASAKLGYKFWDGPLYEQSRAGRGVDADCITIVEVSCRINGS
jgi:hypothetical protein